MKLFTHLFLLVMALGLVITGCKPGSSNDPTPEPSIAITSSSRGSITEEYITRGATGPDATVQINFRAQAAAGITSIAIDEIEAGGGPTRRLATISSGFTKSNTEYSGNYSYVVDTAKAVSTQILRLTLTDKDNRPAVTEFKVNVVNGPFSEIYTVSALGTNFNRRDTLVLPSGAQEMPITLYYKTYTSAQLREIRFSRITGTTESMLQKITTGFTDAYSMQSYLSYRVPATEPAGQFTLRITTVDQQNHSTSTSLVVVKPGLIYRASPIVMGVSSEARATDAALPADIAAALAAGTAGTYYNGFAMASQSRTAAQPVATQIYFLTSVENYFNDTLPALISPNHHDQGLHYGVSSSHMQTSFAPTNINFDNATAADVSALPTSPMSYGSQIVGPGTFIFRRADGHKGLIKVIDAGSYRRYPSSVMVNHNAWFRYQVKSVG